MPKVTSVVLGLALAATGGAVLAPAAGAGAAKKVEIASNFYAPAKKTIKSGDKIRFVWPRFGFDFHDVNVRKGPQRFRSSLQATGSWSHRFKKAGTYVLFCSQHEEMSMKVVVKKR
jgi:plastocyanin